ncbi:TolC family outer membrane protein [Oceanimonas sp. CHS3-5]|uniref:TolC family outer membrane protein n=1 Tax=Oceanimonas sp. CHS3-5 TaxID=3068186 RepID=UPI00273FA201|nr:TolC family outer membrane protein [Oceanimonas sp. CHS3-5]MDP5292473.1 TolC family outer membrane protein [Oceanimonas sp. CHS3-5]
MNPFKSCAVLIAGLCAGMAWAQPPASNAADVVRKAIDTNPEVQASWRTFRAAEYDIDFAKGGYLPTADVTAGYGKQWRNYDDPREFSGAAAEIFVVQMLYDGFKTSSDVKRFENAQLVRYFELLTQLEDTALASVRAYQDVQRYRELVALAEENLASHLEVYEQIEVSARAGVARRADLEQASGRVSLAESNLLTELANLHDVSARYLRIVGELPAADMAPLELNNSKLPVSLQEAMTLAYQGSPAFHAALRNIEAQNAAIDSQKAAFHPELNLSARYGTQDYVNGEVDERRNEGRIGLDLRYNLYRGGRDQASLNKASEEFNQARDLRDKACIDMRQTLQIAYNDVQKLDQQLPILNQHRLSSNRVRAAYKGQFGISERTLLDVLDAQNEYFQASRAYTNAVYDRGTAIARTLTAMGQLLPALEVVSNDLPTLNELGAEPMTVDAESACPADNITAMARYSPAR